MTGRKAWGWGNVNQIRLKCVRQGVTYLLLQLHPGSHEFPALCIAASIAESVAEIVSCALATFATFGAAAECWGEAIMSVADTATTTIPYWVDNFVMC